MSTHAIIGIKLGDEIKSIYCHYDGYSIGPTLKEYYNDSDLANKLIALGSISCLGTTIGKKVDFNKYNSVPAMMERESKGEEMQTVAYHRDRGEPLKIDTYNSIEEFIASNNDYSYIYLYDNGWKFYDKEIDEFVKY